MKETPEWNSVVYDANAHMQQDIANIVMNRFLKLNPTDSVLDIGCGTGAITNGLAKKLPHGKILGLDPSKDMIDYANNKFNGTNLDFVVNNVEHMNYKGAFNWVLSFSCLHWVKDQLSTLKNIHRSLRSNGKFLAFFMTHDILYPYITLKIRQSPRWESYFTNFENERKVYFYGPDGYRILAELSGFNVLQSSLLHIEKTYTLEEYKNILKTWLPDLDKLPEGLHNNYLNDITLEFKCFAKKTNNNKYFYPIDIIVLYAKK